MKEEKMRCNCDTSNRVLDASAIFVLGNFTGPDDLNLIVAKSSKLEIHTVTSDGLRHIIDVHIYGSVTCLQVFRPKVSCRA